MELTSDKPQPSWSDPVAAYADGQPGLSPYLHYWHALCAARHPERAQPPCHCADDGAGIPGQIAESLRQMVRQSLG